MQKLNAEGNTIILITHDNSIAAKAKRIIRITDGRIVYDGPAEGDVTVMNQHGAGEDAPEDERAKGRLDYEYLEMFSNGNVKYCRQQNAFNTLQCSVL